VEFIGLREGWSGRVRSVSSEFIEKGKKVSFRNDNDVS